MRIRYHKNYDKAHRRDIRRAAWTAGAIVVVLLLVAFLIQNWENRAFAFHESTPQTEEKTSDVIYEGMDYSPRQQIETYLFMGIDTTGPATSVSGSAYHGGQADALFLLVVDDEEESWQLLRLNRDSMVNIPVLDLKGKVIGYERQQLALAHAYGDGARISCENTVAAVSALLQNQPIDGYASLNMDGIAVFNDAIGGVTVTITSDFTAVDPTLVEGKTVTLNGQQAFEFIRSRKDVGDQTNLSRMERQRVYLEAMKPQLMALNDEEIIRVYDALSEYLVTDMGSQTLLDTANKLKEYQELPQLVIEGTNTVEEGHVEYILDENSLQKVILELFYRRKDT